MAAVGGGPNLSAPPAAEQLCHPGSCSGAAGAATEATQGRGTVPGGRLGLRVRLRGAAACVDGGRGPRAGPGHLQQLLEGAAEPCHALHPQWGPPATWLLLGETLSLCPACLLRGETEAHREGQSWAEPWELSPSSPLTGWASPKALEGHGVAQGHRDAMYGCAGCTLHKQLQICVFKSSVKKKKKKKQGPDLKEEAPAPKPLYGLMANLAPVPRKKLSPGVGWGWGAVSFVPATRVQWFRFWSPTAWVQVQTEPLPRCVVLEKSPHFSGPHFLHL